MKKQLLEQKTTEGLSIRAIGKYFNISYSAVRYWLKKHGLKTFGHKKINKWSKDKLLNAVKMAECKSDVLRAMDISTKSGNFQTLDKYCRIYSIDTSHLKYQYRGNKFESKKTNEEIFTINSNFSKGSLKKRIIQCGLIEYKCSKCNNDGFWVGKKLVLQLDHINGTTYDNRLCNLRFLCPNCHSQTKTFGAKNKK
jgi:transposase